MQLTDDEIAGYIPMAKRIGRYECKHVGCPEWADDASGAALTVFAKEVQQFDAARSGGTLTSFIEVRMRYRVRDWLRQMQFTNEAGRPRIEYGPLGLIEESSAIESVKPLDFVLQQTVQRAMAELPERWRYVVYQIAVVGRAQDDIGAELRINPSRVSQIYACAIEKMRKRLVN